MQHAARLISILAAAAVVTSCATPGPPQPHLAAGDLRITDYPYNADAHGNDLPVEIARFDVPARHGQPENGKTIELGFLRYPAAEDANGPPTVFLTDKNPNDAVSEELIVRLRQFADVVIFHRRGYGFSAPPPPCPTRLNYPFDAPLMQERLTPIACQHAAACLDALKDAALVPELFASRQVTSDLELLAQVLETERFHLVATGESAGPAVEFTAQSPKRIAKLVVVDLLDPELLPGHAAVKDDITGALAARLENEPIDAVLEGHGGQQFNIAIGVLDLAFLRREPSFDLTAAASAASNGSNDALAELVLRMRQQLGQTSSIEILLAMPSGSCLADTPARMTDSAYAANWPRSALAPTTQTPQESTDNAGHLLLQRADVLRLKTSTDLDIEAEILAFLTEQGLKQN